MESKKPPAYYSWIMFISCDTGYQLQYKMSNIYWNTAIYRFSFKSEVKSKMATLKQYSLLFFFLYNAWIKNYLQHWLIYSTSMNHCLDS